MKKEKAECLFDEAYAWLCKSRRNHPANADIWDFRFKWHKDKPAILSAFLHGNFRLDTQRRIALNSNDEIDVYKSDDALVIKILTRLIENRILGKISKRCFHVKGQGGLKGAVRAVAANRNKYPFVFRTDVKSYYNSIDHETLLSMLGVHVKNCKLICLVRQYLERTVEKDGIYRDVARGIPMGSSLSPLMGALYLSKLDAKLSEMGVFYVRYMDDILVMTSTRWKLRKAVKIVNEQLNVLGLHKHPDKTFIGRVEKGFDFLGYHFGPEALSLAEKTIDNFINNALRLYEQEPPVSRQGRLEAYTTNWIRWAYGGLGNDSRTCAG